MAAIEDSRARSAVCQTEWRHWETKDRPLATIPLSVLDELRVLRCWAEEELDRKSWAEHRAAEAAKNAPGIATAAG